MGGTVSYDYDYDHQYKAVNWLSVKKRVFVEMLIYLDTMFMIRSNATGYLV